MAKVDGARWLGWVSKLSGAEPVTVAGQSVVIETRNSVAMAAGAPNALAVEWLLEQLRARFPEDAIEVQEFRENWRNVSVTKVGRQLPDEVIVVMAHLDSIVMDTASPTAPAPGADDDASGAAVLLELATMLPEVALRRTVRLVWISGEEQGLVGCPTWSMDQEVDQIRAAIVLDMIAWDGQGERRLQVHTKDDAASLLLLDCIANSNEAYGFGLNLDPRLGDEALGNSCHSDLWGRGVPAAWVTENQVPPGPLNPFAHSAGDTVDTLAIPYGVDMARAAVASVLGLAEPL